MATKHLLFVICGIFLINLVCAGEYNNFIDNAYAFNNDSDFEVRLNQLEIDSNGTVIFMSVKTLGDMSTSQAYSTYAIGQNGINKRGSPEKNVFILYIEDMNHYYVHTAFNREMDQAIIDLLVYSGRAGNMELGISEAIDFIEKIYKGQIKEGTSFYGDFGEAKLCYDGFIYHNGEKSNYFIKEIKQSFYISGQTSSYELRKDGFFSNPVVGGVTMSGVISVGEKYKKKDRVLDDIDGKDLVKERILRDIGKLEKEKVSLENVFRFYKHITIFYGGLRTKYYIKGKNMFGNDYYEIWRAETGFDIKVGELSMGGVLFFDDEYEDADTISKAINENYAFDGCQIHYIEKSDKNVAKAE